MIDLCDLFVRWAHSSHIQRWDSPEQAWESWARAKGWLREDQPSTGLRCQSCQEYFELTVLTDPNGKAVHYLVCPFCTLQPVDDEQLRRWKWQHERIVEALARLFTPPGKTVVVVPEQIWALGRLVLGQRRPLLILVRSRQAMKDHRTSQWLRQNNSVVALFPNQSEAADWSDQAIVLSDVIRLVGNQLQLQDGWKYVFAEILSGTEVPKVPPTKRRDERDRNIVLIFNHLIEFMKLKQKLIKEDFLARREYTLLPCPKQKEIAAALGLKEPTVSKCLNDPKAESLQVLWKMVQSEDVEECLNFRVPSARQSDIQRHRNDLLVGLED